MKKYTLEEFIKKARKIHGWKYDYSKVIYINNQTKVIIICPIHGEFEQTPESHLKGCNCLKCYNNKRLLTIEEFIRRAILVHGYRFDYSKVIYLGSHIKVIIICPVHGEFEQLPFDHLNGSGCSKCKIDKLSNLRRLTKEEVIQKFIEVHRYRFDYSKFIYVNSWTKGIIICPIHGEFEQTPNGHLAGNGCNKCGKTIIGDKLRSNLEEFIPKSREVHGDRNGYDNFIYVNNWTKGCITCLVNKDHGDYWQTPNSHLRGNGCPKCKSSKGELTIQAILDKYNIKSEPQYKIPEVVANYEYDFYLPEYNLLIEFHGIQHYEYVPFFHRKGEDEFLAKKNRDDIKKDNAYSFKYRFLEFNYKQFKYMTKEEFEEMVLRKINQQF